jgi:CheY-like chemotaxis protein
MPFMNGIAATETIMARKDGHKKAKVVFVTAHVSPDFEAQCHKAGGSAFLPKPFRIEDIELCFRQLRKSGLIVEP